MTLVQTYYVPGLAAIVLNTHDDQPTLMIVLDPSYRGDLNDIAKSSPGSDDVYLYCNDASAINNPALAKFMEVLTHWDHTGDGLPDCDEIINAIETALWQSRETPDELHRPSGTWFSRLCMSFMPPAPERHIVYSFGKLQPRFRWYHHAAALPMIAMFIGLMMLQNHFLPWMHYSAITGFMALAEWQGYSSWVGLAALIVLVNLPGKRRSKTKSSISKNTHGFFSKAALYEEQVWREGSENWSWSGRVRSCVSFGLIHLANLFYPLATILPLAIGGGLLMAIYLHTYRKTRFRRSAVLASTVWHRVYNRIALIALVISLSLWVDVKVLGLFAVLGLFFVINHMRKRRNTAKITQQGVKEAAGFSD